VRQCEEVVHFYLEFDPPKRTKEKLKYFVGSDTGRGSIGDVMPEAVAAQFWATLEQTFH
jgi:hypothetical protein